VVSAAKARPQPRQTSAPALFSAWQAGQFIEALAEVCGNRTR